MLRKRGTAVAAALVLVSTMGAAIAGSDNQSALAPGKAATVKQARGSNNGTYLLIGGGLVAGGLALILTGNGNGTAGNTTNSTTLP